VSTFFGAVRLTDDGSVSRPDFSPLPDGMDRRLESPRALVVHRLRVVTPEDRNERQPRPAWGGGGWIAFAGRLDDRSNLAAALGFESPECPPDGELASRAFERWGVEGFGRLLGDFTLAGWHEEKRELSLVADPMGMRTIYYWRKGGLVLFATGLPELIRMPGVPRALNEAFIADFLATNFGDDEYTCYRDIVKVRPGTAAVLTPGGIRTVELHRFDAERRIRLKDDRDYLEAAREILARTIADRRRSIGPVPFSVSGGLDSACLMVGAGAGTAPITTLTAIPDPHVESFVPRRRYDDERSLVELVAGALPGIRSEFLAPSPETDWNPAGLSLAAATATPQWSPTQVAWFDAMHRRATALGARSIMAGALGNLTLTWDGLRGLPGRLLRGEWLTLARELVLGSRGNPRRLAGLAKHEVIDPLRRRDLRPEALTATTCLRPEAIQEFAILDRMRRFGNDRPVGFGADSRLWRIHIIQRNRCRRPEATGLMRARYGLDPLAPLGDPRLVEFCLAIPEDQFLRNGTDRWLARRLLRKAGVPPQIAENRRRGLQHPEWFAHLTSMRSALPAQIERLRRSPAASRLIDIDRLERLVQDWPTSPAAAERRVLIYNALVLHAFNIGAFITWVEGDT